MQASTSGLQSGLESAEPARGYTAPPPPECRIHARGFGLAADFVLPSLAEVYEEAERISEVLNEPVDAVVFRDSHSPHFPCICQPFVWYHKLQTFFNFSLFVDPQDVPPDLLPLCVIALEAYGTILYKANAEERPRVLRCLPIDLEGEQSEEGVATYLMANIRYKLGVINLTPTLNQPEKSVKVFQGMINSLEECFGDPWIENATLYNWLARALLFAGGQDNCKRAKAALGKPLSCSKINLSEMVEARSLLERVLRALQEDAAADVEEAWLITWYRKNPHMLKESVLREQLLVTDTEPTRILQALGGLKWLQNRRPTDKTEARRIQQCKWCMQREPLVKLRHCVKCKSVLYCSKECQTEHWPLHRPTCMDIRRERVRIEQVSQVDGAAAQRLADFQKWTRIPHEGIRDALVHALGLHRDRARGRSHIVIRTITWMANAKTLRGRFHVKACGVFKISDALPQIERLPGREKGQLQRSVDTQLADADAAAWNVIPLLHMSLIDGDQERSPIGIMGISEEGIRSMDYEPDWRKLMNINGDRPAKLQLLNLQDVEHVF